MSRHRFDHAAAKAYFVSLNPGERSTRRVAEQFKVTLRTARKWRDRDNWDEAAEAADVAAAAALERQAVKTREQRALQDARIRDRAAQRVQDRLEAADVGDDWIRQVLADADKRVRLNEGEATDHVSVGVVQAGFRESLAAAAALVKELVERGVAGDDLVRVFRAELPARVQERLALIGGDEACVSCRMAAARGGAAARRGRASRISPTATSSPSTAGSSSRPRPTSTLTPAPARRPRRRR
jgi:hypothetical protein